jgi:serine protease 16
MVDMARQRGALVLALEHRFYGPSQPTGDVTVASLRFLSSSQALADAARF